MHFIFSLLCFLFVPLASHAQGSGSDPNSLFVEAHQRYEMAIEASGAARIGMLQEVGAILDRIEAEFPETTPARLIREGGSLGGMDLGTVRAAADVAPTEIPQATRNAIATVADHACQAVTAACAEDIAAALETVIGDVLFSGMERAVHAEKRRILFSNPGKLNSPLERVELFEQMYQDPEFAAEFDTRALSGALTSQDRLKDIAPEAVADFGYSLVTSVVTELLARHYEASGQDTAAEQTRRWMAPVVDITLLTTGAGQATASGTAPGAVLIWAKNFVAFVELGAQQQAAVESGATRDRQLAKLAADIESIHQTLRSGQLTGSMFDTSGRLGDPLLPDLEAVLRDTLEEYYDLQTWWLESPEAGILEDLGFVLEAARRFVNPGHASGLEHANSTNALPEQPVPLTATAREPAGWRLVEHPDFTIRLGERKKGVVMKSDGTAWYAGQRLFAAPTAPGDSELHVFIAPDGVTLLVIQADLDYGGLRLGIVNTAARRIVTGSLIEEHQVRGLGRPKDVRQVGHPVVWSPDGQHAALLYSPAEWEAELAVIDIKTGGLQIVRVDGLPGTQWESAELETLEVVSENTHGVDFSIWACRAANTCDPEKQGRRRIEFRLDGKSVAPSRDRESPWGPEIVVPSDNSVWQSDPVYDEETLSDPVAELRRHGVPEAAIRFAVAHDAREPGEVLPSAFEELGQVDLVRMDPGHIAYTSDRFRPPVFVNGTPDIVEFEGMGLDLASKFRDSASRRFLRAHPKAYGYIFGVFHRKTPWGGQRFIFASDLVDGCRVCPSVGTAVWYWDFNDGKLVDKTYVGLVDPGVDFQFDGQAAGQGGTGWEFAQFDRYPKTLQYRLNLMGYDAGPMDGVPGQKTVQALKSFQTEWCLPRSGTVDTATLAALRTARGPQPAFSETGCPETSAGPGLLGKFELVQQPTEINCAQSPLIVEPDRVVFYESQCALDRPISDGAAEHETDATCTGEGSNWRTAFRFSKEPNGILGIYHPDQDFTSYFQPCDIAPLPPADPATYSTDAKALQSRLSALGFDAGPADGYPGPQTREALMRFQRSHCLTPTAQPDPATRNALASATRKGGGCAGLPMPNGISANTPLHSGIYVNATHSCDRGELGKDADWSMRIIRGLVTTFGYHLHCTTGRTDIRDGVTQWSGECAEGPEPFDLRWSLDVLSNEEFVEKRSPYDFVEVNGVRKSPNGQRYVRCPDDSYQAKQWATWFQ